MANCDICEQQFSSCDTHHIVSKSKGGTNDVWNRTSLCPNCHRLVHVGEIIIEGKFLTTNEGFKVIWRKKDTESITGIQDPKVFTYRGQQK